MLSAWLFWFIKMRLEVPTGRNAENLPSFESRLQHIRITRVFVGGFPQAQGLLLSRLEMGG